MQAEGYKRSVEEIKLASKVAITGNVLLYEDNPGGRRSGRGLDLPTILPTPVLLVPGILGSTVKDTWGAYPKLHFSSPKDIYGNDLKAWELLKSKWQLHEPYKIPGKDDSLSEVGWYKLKAELRKEGYIDGETLFEAPYDWSLSLPNARDAYLVKYIRDAKEAYAKAYERLTGQEAKDIKVDIIAHSMGGLLARSYIQSSSYANDVRKFAMVGTPSKGATMAYYIWEGGDPKTADETAEELKPIVNEEQKNILKSIIKTTAAGGAYMYSNALSLAAKVKYNDNKKICDFSFGGYGSEPLRCYHKNIRDMLKDCQSLKQLMPIYDNAIVDMDTNEPQYIIEEENSFLQALNGLTCHDHRLVLPELRECIDNFGKPYNFISPRKVLGNSYENNMVQTKLFVGINMATLNSIYVTPQLDIHSDIYRDGIITSENYKTQTAYGDGTVLANSAIFNDYFPSALDVLSLKKKQGGHASLIDIFAKDIVDFITERKIVEEEEQKLLKYSQLAINIDGKMQPLSVMKDGKTISVTKEIQLDNSSVVIDNPSDGAYIVNLQGRSKGVEDVEITINYVDSNGININEARVFSYDSQNGKKLSSFSFTLDAKQPNRLVMSRSFGVPILDIEKDSHGQVQLSWLDYVGMFNKDVDHYEIYWKKADDVYYQLLDVATGSDSNYLTSHAATEAINDGYVYVVKSVFKNGKSSFFSNSIAYTDEPYTVCNSLEANSKTVPGFINFNVDGKADKTQCSLSLPGNTGLINKFEGTINLPVGYQEDKDVYYSCNDGAKVMLNSSNEKQVFACKEGESMKINVDGSSWGQLNGIGRLRGTLSQYSQNDDNVASSDVVPMVGKFMAIVGVVVAFF